MKIGLVGLVEHEWLATMPLLEHDDVMYLDFVSEGRRLCRLLREEYAVDMVIALTHMRAPNDLQLGAQVPGIDLILGGHDHHYSVERCHPGSTLLFKSGTDFRELSLIRMHQGDSSWAVCSFPVTPDATVACSSGSVARVTVPSPAACFNSALRLTCMAERTWEQP